MKTFSANAKYHLASFAQETLRLAREDRAGDIAEAFKSEVLRLLECGAVDEDDHNRGMMFGVALENIALRYIGNIPSSSHDRRTLNNLRKF